MPKHQSNALATLRKERGFTQDELAEKSGISVKTLQLWEANGTMSANVSKLSTVAATLGVELSEVLC